MPHFEILGTIDPLLSVKLEKGETILAESNAMVSMDSTLELKGKTQGGFMKSLGRAVLQGESFFQQEIRATDGPGEILLAPTVPGDMKILEVGSKQYCLSDGAFLACSAGVETETKSQGIGKSLFGGTGGFMIMQTKGNGQTVISGFGSLREVQVSPEKDLIVDNGHVVAWDSGLSYETVLSTAKSSGFLGKLANSAMSGEGVVLRFKGHGSVFVCSRNQGGFLSWIFAHAPTKE